MTYGSSLLQNEDMKETAVKKSIIFLSALLLGCQEKPITPMPPLVTDQAACPAACSNLQKLGCEEGRPIDMGMSCKDDSGCHVGHTCQAGKCVASCNKFCVDTENNGVWLDPICISGIMSCSQVEDCPRRKR